MLEKIMISQSLQEHNAGVGTYGVEATRMREVAKIAAQFLKLWGYDVRVSPLAFVALNEPQDFYSAIRYSNRFGADLHVCLHSNTTPGTITFFHGGSTDGKRLATCMQRRIAPISPKKDLGVRADTTIYQSGFAELRLTAATSCLVELFSHVDRVEVRHFLKNRESYGLAIAWAVCDYYRRVPGMPKLRV